MKITDRVKHYLKQKHMMQLATINSGKPWSCTVYYVVDDKLNLYWASLPSRRHSQEIANCDNVAISVPVQYNKDLKVIGIQAEGTAKMLEKPAEIKPIAKKYADAFGRDQQWVEDFSSLKTEHRLYKFSPSKIVLFDEENYPNDPRKEVSIGG